MKWIKWLTGTMLFFLAETLTAQNVYYYPKASGNILSTATWGTNTDGSGTAPASFSIPNAAYHFKNRSSFNLYALGNFIVSGNNTFIVIGDGTNALSFYLPSGYTLRADSVFLHANTNMQVTGNFDCAKPAFALNSSVNYADTTALQPILGGVYGNLYLTLGGSKKLKGDVQVRGIFSLSDKQLFCDTFTLTSGESVTSPGTLYFSNSNNLSAMIVGKFRRWIPSGMVGTNQGLFPLGNGIKYLPIQLNISSLPSTGGLMSAEFFPYWPGNTGLPFIDSSFTPYVNVNRVHAIGYWRLRVESGLSGTTYTVSVSPLNLNGILWEGAIRLLKRNMYAGIWGKPGNSNVVSGNAYIPTIGRSGLTSIEGDYAMASDSNINVLPVHMLSFTGKIINRDIEFHWATATESNTKEFLIEQMENENWVRLANIPAAGFSQKLNTYSISIPNIRNMESGVFRLMAIDLDGQLSYSKTIELHIEIKSSELRIGPNPFLDEIEFSGLSSTDQTGIEIRNQLGQKVYDEIGLSVGQESCKINTTGLLPGLYYISLTQNGLVQQQKLIKL